MKTVEKGKIRGRYTIFGYDPDLILKHTTRKYLNNFKKQKTLLNF